jgi:hypothetical protein
MRRAFLVGKKVLLRRRKSGKPSATSSPYTAKIGARSSLTELQTHKLICWQTSVQSTFIATSDHVFYFFCRSQWPRGLRRRYSAARLLRLWVRIPLEAWMFVVSVVCCQVEVSATDWLLVQRSPTDCGASLCDRETTQKNEEAKARYRAVKIQP